MEILAKLFPKWVAPKKQVDVALDLTDYVQKLYAGAIFKSGLEEEMLEKVERDGTCTDLEHTDIGLTPHAQFFILNLICHACQEMELDESDQMMDVIAHVMSEALRMEPGVVNDLTMAYLKWFTAVAAQINAAEEDGEPAPDEVDHRMFRASCAAAKRFAQAMGTAAADPIDEEIVFFTTLCESLPAEG